MAKLAVVTGTAILGLLSTLGACRGVNPQLGILPPSLSERPREPDLTRPLVESRPPPEGTAAARAKVSVRPSVEVSVASVLSWLLAGAAGGGLPLIGVFGTFDEVTIIGVDTAVVPSPGEEEEEPTAPPLDLIVR